MSSRNFFECLQPEISSFLLSRVDITGLQIINSTPSHAPRLVFIVQSYLYTGKNNRFPFLDILGYLKNTHKNPKFGRVRQVPIREVGWEFPGWDLSHFAKFGIFMGIL